MKLDVATAEKRLADYVRARDLDADVSSEVALTLYRSAFATLYGAEPATKKERQEAVALREAVEALYPWFRQDPVVRAYEKRPQRPARVDVVFETTKPVAGFVVLQPGKGHVRGTAVRFRGVYPATEAETHAEEPLLTVLAHFQHYLDVIDESTPVQVYYATAVEGAPDQRVLRPRGSALSLSTFYNELR